MHAGWLVFKKRKWSHKLWVIIITFFLKSFLRLYLQQQQQKMGSCPVSRSTYLNLSLVLGMVSLSFFQKMAGGGMPNTRHSSLAGFPSGIPVFCSFSTKWGGCFTSFSMGDMTYVTLQCIFKRAGNHFSVKWILARVKSQFCGLVDWVLMTLIFHNWVW